MNASESNRQLAHTFGQQIVSTQAGDGYVAPEPVLESPVVVEKEFQKDVVSEAKFYQGVPAPIDGNGMIASEWAQKAYVPMLVGQQEWTAGHTGFEFREGRPTGVFSTLICGSICKTHLIGAPTTTSNAGHRSI